MAPAHLARPSFSRRVLCLAAALWPAAAVAQAKKPAAAATEPSISAARSIMAGAPLSVFLSRAPQGSRLAIARPDDPADKAIIVL
jgi:hypothetical protein